ncbi:MAG: hypothetical protein HQK74_01165 [Desulfamplus sp.]|nr:hypothetical protein [Desulfamplus sp.]
MDKECSVEKNKKVRKRRAKKNAIKKEGYAAINPSSYKIGRLVNINTGAINTSSSAGLSSVGSLVFKYSDKEDDNLQVTDTKAQSIFLESYGYYLGDIVINDDSPFLIDAQPKITIQEVDFSNISSEILMKIRAMSIGFTELNSRQIFALDKFIRENMNQKRFSSIHLTVGSQ